MTLLCAARIGWAQPAAPPADPAKLPAEIPIFPLPDVVLFPSASMPLLIFEPRYREMVADALKGDRIIGMVLLRPGYEADYEGRPPIREIGCAGQITSFERLPDGRYTILLRGFVKFRVTSEDQRRPYRLARVDPLPEVPSAGDRADLSKVRFKLESLLADAIPPDSNLRSLADDDFVNVVAQNVGLDPIERQQLLELSGVLPRARALVALLESRGSPRRRARR
jgi:Lon protease-like protein